MRAGVDQVAVGLHEADERLLVEFRETLDQPLQADVADLADFELRQVAEEQRFLAAATVESISMRSSGKPQIRSGSPVLTLPIETR